MKTRLRSKTNRPLVWLLEVTWKRRKGQPREYIGVCNGGVVHVLLFHKSIADELKVPQSWINFKLHTLAEFKKLASRLYEQYAAKPSPADKGAKP